LAAYQLVVAGPLFALYRYFFVLLLHINIRMFAIVQAPLIGLASAVTSQTQAMWLCNTDMQVSMMYWMQRKNPYLEGCCGA